MVGNLRTGGFVLNAVTNSILKNQKLNIARTVVQRWRVITMIDIDEYKEVLEALESGFIEIIDIEQHRKATCEALEKQIPKRLTIKLSEQMIQGYLYRDKCCYCPMCDSFRGNLDYEPQKIRKYDFCPDCGQALDWGDGKCNG